MGMLPSKYTVAASVLAISVAGAGAAFSQESEARGVDLPPPGENVPGFGPEAPDGFELLERDIFNTPNYYLDEELWSDPQYFRCNSPRHLTDMHTNLNPGLAGSVARIGTNPPETAEWGDCNVDYPREHIVSPYPFETAQEHYEALMAEAESRGGPTIYDGNSMPDWHGFYSRPIAEGAHWNWGRQTQTPTMLSLLTPEYQTRLVQSLYHEGVTNYAQWPAAYCWPEGFTRWWAQFAISNRVQWVLSPDVIVVWTGNTMNFIRSINLNREFIIEEGSVPRLGGDVPRWYGESIGFWDDETLIVWTSNVQAWTQHTSWENSYQLQTIEIYNAEYNDDGSMAGLHSEVIFYDPEALVEPVRIVNFQRRTEDTDTAPPAVFLECLQTIYPINDFATRVVSGEEVTFTMIDYFDRPWAQIFNRVEDRLGIERPAAFDGLFDFD